MMKIVERIGVAGVVMNGGKVLIIQRAADDDYMPNLWEIPSGKREPSEKTIDGAKRETEEESGLKVEIGFPVGVFEYTVEKFDEIRNVTQISFLAKPVNGTEVHLSNEHQNFAWITENEIDKYKISPETKEIIKKAFTTSKNH
jgi:8-oxo-dGTP diphosphatase